MDSAGKVIYAGKAVSLKKRVRSHFGKDSLDSRHMAMITRVRTVDYIPTRDEKEALVLEDQLIKSIQPKYNILLRDDKTYPYLELTSGEEFPALKVSRRKENPGSEYYGPFPNVRDMRKAKKTAEKIFPLRKCEALRERKRPCLNHQIESCPSPCTGRVNRERYLETVEELRMFLQGKTGTLTEKLAERMNRFKENLEFEKAAQVRDQIARIKGLFPAVNARKVSREKLRIITRIDPLLHLKELLELEGVPEVIEGFDISHTSSRQAVGSMVRFVNGKPDKSSYRRFKVRQEETSDDLSMLKEVVYRRLKRLMKEKKKIPDIIFVDGGKGQERAAAAVTAALGLEGIRTISLAKQKGVVYHRGRRLGIDPGTETWRLIKRIDEEAHRFAHSYHTERRDRLP